MMATDDCGTRRRVKLYMLNEDRQWDDKGTGHVSSSFVEAQKGIALIVISESDGSVLLESKIQSDTAYQKQQETLIVWSEGESVDLALSFQEKVGCEEIWEKICNVQGKDPSVEITQDVVDESDGEETECEIPGSSMIVECGFELPSADLAHLEDLLEVITSAMLSVPKRERLVAALERPGYLHQLFGDVFHTAEDLEDKEALHHIHDILRNIIMLNKDALYKIIFSDNLIMDVIGVLEYEPARSVRIRHRDFLNCQSLFRDVLPLHSSELRAKIHQTYRVQYIQDCILPTPSLFEDNVLSTLTSFIFFNKVDITTCVMEDEKLMSQLFAHLMDEETEPTRLRDLASFLKELCTFSQTLQATQRDIFFKTLMSLKALRAVTVMFSCADNHVRSAATDILSYFVEYSPSMVRDFMLAEANELPPREDDDLLINIIIEQLKNDTDTELAGALQLCGLIRLIIDPENMMPINNSYPRVLLQRTEKTEFLGFFYKRAMNTLTAPLFANTTEDRPCKDDYRTALLLQYLLEIIAFCIEHHSYHMKNYVLSKDLVKRVLVLLKSRHTFLVLGALRLFRRVVGMKEEFYNRYLTKNVLFEPVLELFRSRGHRYNLLNSALIELFEFIRQEDIQSFIIHTVENYWEEMRHVNYVKTFKGLKIRYEQIQDRLSCSGLSMNGGNSAGLGIALDSGPFSNAYASGLTSVTNRFRRFARAINEEDESWFDAEEENDVETDIDGGLPTDESCTNVDIGRINISSNGSDITDVDGSFRLFADRNDVPAASDSVEKDVNGVGGGVLKNESSFTLLKSTLPIIEADYVVSSNCSSISFPARLGSSLVDYDEDSDEDSDEDDVEDENSASVCDVVEPRRTPIFDEDGPQSKRRRTNAMEDTSSACVSAVGGALHRTSAFVRNLLIQDGGGETEKTVTVVPTVVEPISEIDSAAATATKRL